MKSEDGRASYNGILSFGSGFRGLSTFEAVLDLGRNRCSNKLPRELRRSYSGPVKSTNGVPYVAEDIILSASCRRSCGRRWFRIRRRVSPQAGKMLQDLQRRWVLLQRLSRAKMPWGSMLFCELQEALLHRFVHSFAFSSFLLCSMGIVCL